MEPNTQQETYLGKIDATPKWRDTICHALEIVETSDSPEARGYARDTINDCAEKLDRILYQESPEEPDLSDDVIIAIKRELMVTHGDLIFHRAAIVDRGHDRADLALYSFKTPSGRMAYASKVEDCVRDTDSVEFAAIIATAALDGAVVAIKQNPSTQ